MSDITSWRIVTRDRFSGEVKIFSETDNLEEHRDFVETLAKYVNRFSGYRLDKYDSRLCQWESYYTVGVIGQNYVFIDGRGVYCGNSLS